MGSVFCNFNHLGWDTQTLLSPPLLQEQHTLHSSKVGREDEGVSSNRPELVTLTECLDSHEDDINLLYLTYCEATLQVIHTESIPLMMKNGLDAERSSGIHSMKKQISERRWDSVKSKRRSYGTTQLTELYTNGR